uniref:Peptidoglycan recognition protein L1, isoform B n=1 Tax=Plautia stali TaxID=106108 RepID=A0A499U589_PLAST|nr:peptidoglycan recognition protein L1, isoform B [Plautia stali]
MSLAIKENDLRVSEIKLPSPSDLCLGQISLKNCKDATIGTKIDGNIIVNQYFNDIPADKALSEGLTFTDSVVLEDWTQKLLKYKYVWLSLISAVVVTTVLCILYIPRIPHQDSSEDAQLPHNYSLRLRTRPEWFSTKTEVNCKPLLIHPAKYVVIGHTVSTNCYKQINCENVMKELQEYHLKIDFCDIGYNFVIGGDGYIYEGRGWGIFGAHTKAFNCHSIGIAFTGNYNEGLLSPTMEEALKLLIEEGLKLGEIADDYKLFGHCQIRKSDSPGVHVMEKIKKWKHWSEPKPEDYMCT